MEFLLFFVKVNNNHGNLILFTHFSLCCCWSIFSCIFVCATPPIRIVGLRRLQATTILGIDMLFIQVSSYVFLVLPVASVVGVMFLWNFCYFL